MLSAYACVAGISGLSILIGHGVHRLGGGAGSTWLSGGLGLAAAMSVGAAAVRLPGHGWTVLGLLVALSAPGAVMLWPQRRRWRLELGPGVLAAGVVLAAVSLPFLLNGRFGLLGAHVDDDLGFHLAWAEALSSGHGGFALIDSVDPGYPIGPHALVAAFAPPVGTLAAFTAFLMAAPVLTALAALSLLRDARAGLRVLGAALVGLPYLPVSYLAEGSFKEPALALLVVTFALVLRELRAQPRARGAVPLAILGLGCVVTFGVQGLVWPAALLGAWWLAERSRGRHPAGPSRLRLRPLLVGALVAAAGLVAIDAARLRALTALGSFTPHSSSVGGNFVRAVSPFTGLGGWPVADFRLAPDSTVKVGLTTGVVALTLIYASVRCARRGDRPLLAMAGAAILVYGVSAATTVPYLSVKALVVVAPLLVLIAARGLLASRAGWAPVLAGLTFAALAAWSSATALRGASVSASGAAEELRALRPLLRHGPTLLLFADHYARWELLGVRIGSLSPYNFVPDVKASVRPGKSPLTLDFDSVRPDQLDRFRFAVTRRGPYGSVPEANWRLRRRLAYFDVWERRGPTPARAILDEEDRPGAVLACPAGGRAPGGGVAAIRAAPVLGGAEAWRIPGATAPSRGGAAPLAPGREMSQTLALPAGRWTLSLRYASPVAMSLRAGPLSARLPAATEPLGRFHPAGVVRGGAGVRVTVRAERGSRGLIARDAEVDAIAATPAPWGVRTVPAKRACGRYVDWLTPSSG